MDTLYLYSLIPVLSTALLLYFSVVLRGPVPRELRGLTLFLGAIAVQMLALVLCFLPAWAWIGQRFAAIGTLVVAGYYHAVWDMTGQPRRWMLWAVDALAVVIALVGVVYPGILYNPSTLSAGPLFWWAMALALTGALIPAAQLVLAMRGVEGNQRLLLVRLGLAGLCCLVGAWINATLLAHGYKLPFGLFLVLCSMWLLGKIVGQVQSPIARKIIDRSLLYCALGAMLSAGVLFGALSMMEEGFDRKPYGLSALFLLTMAAIALEPLRQYVTERVGHQLLSTRSTSEQLATELVSTRARQDQEERLVELGTFSSAIAHEVRNPLGVLKANLRLMELEGSGDEELIEEMHGQIRRAEEFISDLLDYGRLRPLDLQLFDLRYVIELAISSVRGHRQHLCEAVEWSMDLPEHEVTLEADQGQLVQLFIILVDNAMLATRHVDERHVRVRLWREDDTICVQVEDSGEGIAATMSERLFEPFATSRPREEGGTGLGLAIAARIVAQHAGKIQVTSGDLPGAAFRVSLPTMQSLLPERS